MVFVAIVIAAPGSKAISQDVRWLKSAQTAVNESHQTGRMVLVSVGADWCHYCKKMDRETWKNRAVSRAISDGYVPLKLMDEDHKELIAALQIKAFPSTLVFSSDRQLIARIDGYVEPAKMLEVLDQIRLSTRVNTPPTR